MQAIFIILLVIFSVGIGFFLGVLVLSLDTPLKDILAFGSGEIEQEEERPAPAPMVKERDKRDKPNADADPLLQVWQVADDSLLYGFTGEYVTKQELPDHILALLTPAKEKEETEIVAPISPDVEGSPSQEVIGTEEVEGEIKPLSLINEIDEILQEKLAQSPLSDKGIKLTENHKKEITIWVGLKSYPTIEDVPDPEIQRLIKESVQEWENRK